MELLIKIISTPLTWGMILLTINLLYGFLNYRHSKTEAKKKEYLEFYAPISQHLKTSEMLHKILKKNRPEDFRLVKALFENKGQFSDYEISIISQIIDIGDKVNKLLNSKNYAYSNEDFSEQVAKYKAHLVVLKLLNSNNFNPGNHSYKDFEDYVFPREFAKMIQENLK